MTIFMIGIFVGVAVGFVNAALCQTSGRADDVSQQMWEQLRGKQHG